MKKFLSYLVGVIAFIAIQAISMFLTLKFGIGLLVIGIALFMVAESVFFTDDENYWGKEYFNSQLVSSRRMLAIHVCFFIATLLLAEELGVIKGYVIVNSGVYVSGASWFALSVLVLCRIADQLWIEHVLHKDLKICELEEKEKQTSLSK